MAPPPTYAPAATQQRPYYPTPAYPSTLPASPQSSALGPPAGEKVESPRKGFIDWAFEGLKDKAPEFGANLTTTRANFSEAGKAFRKAFRAPLSFCITIVAAAVNAYTRGQGTIGETAGKLAVGAAHATIADLARPKSADEPSPDVQGEGDHALRTVPDDDAHTSA